jgi:uncharacterized protein with PIN domain
LQCQRAHRSHAHDPHAEEGWRSRDPEVVRISCQEKRILLTRDCGVLKHSAVTYGYWRRETDSRRQAAEIVRRFDLAQLLRPLTRCMVCNEPLKAALKAEVRGRVPPGTLE